MTNKTIIKVVDVETRSNWTSLEDVLKVFGKSEVLEMVQRYQDAQVHAVNYRKKAQVKAKLMKERLAELEAKVSSGLLVEVPEEDGDEEGEA